MSRTTTAADDDLTTEARIASAGAESGHSPQLSPPDGQQRTPGTRADLALHEGAADAPVATGDDDPAPRAADDDLTTPAARPVDAAPAPRALTDDEVASLRQQRTTLRQQRTKAQREADRLGVRADAITAALVAVGAEEPEEADDAR